MRGAGEWLQLFLLRHRSLATTERYLHLTITELKEAHRRFHPREKGVAE